LWDSTFSLFPRHSQNNDYISTKFSISPWHKTLAISHKFIQTQSETPHMSLDQKRNLCSHHRILWLQTSQDAKHQNFPNTTLTPNELACNPTWQQTPYCLYPQKPTINSPSFQLNLHQNTIQIRRAKTKSFKCQSSISGLGFVGHIRRLQ
jgi:hypothetical protein